MDIEKARGIMNISDMLEVSNILMTCNAYWTYRGLPNEPHALLTNGKHSDSYFNVNEVTKYPNFRETLAEMIAARLDIVGIKDIDIVISSTYAATSIGQAVADNLDAIFVFTEKNLKYQLWSGRFEIPSGGARMLQVEELITTLETTKKVKAAVLDANPDIEFVKINGKIVVATIIHRPSQLPIEYDSYIVIPLYEGEVHNWTPEECPLCKKGSEVLPPKPNWERFV